MWTNAECSKYYLCLDGEVFEFKCSVGLLFDVARQICDFKQNVENCDITAGKYADKQEHVFLLGKISHWLTTNDKIQLKSSFKQKNCNFCNLFKQNF